MATHLSVRTLALLLCVWLSTVPQCAITNGTLLQESERPDEFAGALSAFDFVPDILLYFNKTDFRNFDETSPAFLAALASPGVSFRFEPHLPFDIGPAADNGIARPTGRSPPARS